MSTLISIEKAARYTYDAVKSVLGSSDVTLVDVSAAAEGIEAPIGLLMWFGEEHPEWPFLRSFTELWKLQCRRFVLLAPAHIKTRPWDHLPPIQRGAIASLFTDSAVDATQLMTVIQRVSSNIQPSDWVAHRTQRTIEACALQQLLRHFGHASKNDLSNQFLAPARLLLKHGAIGLDAGIPNEWKDVWNRFNAKVLAPVAADSSYGVLGEEFVAAGKPIDAAIASDTPPVVSDMERMMALLTECRVLSGTHTASDKCVSQPSAVQGEAFNILVVDDHAASWMPVFEQLQNDLANDFGRVEFDYSLDGKTREAGGAIHWGHYDLVILDVFIGRDDGRDILNKLRKDFGQLPVLLWTTSRDDEITSKASLANGVLLKKTVAPEVLRQTIGKWVAAGSARKSFALPNPFFDHVITNQGYRELANRCNEWCLTQLDSFHALDGAFFRYFADHGGRHIVKILELLQAALTPFLSQSPVLLADDPEARQFEIFSLYLAVICHELGMFPLRQGSRAVGDYSVGNVEDFSALGWDYLSDVRTLHALRGLVLLQADAALISYWSDDRGTDLGKEMRTNPFRHPKMEEIFVADAVAVLVGYHARCLKSLKQNVFLDWDAAWNDPIDVQARFGKLRSPAVTLSKTQAVFKQAITDLSNKVGNDPYRDRLRKQCALLRFVDSIDVCQSRNPAQFLILGKGRNAKNNVEYLKRQVSEKISIRSSKDSAFVEATLTAPQPDPDKIEQVLQSRDSTYVLTPKGKAFVDQPWNQESTDTIRELQKRLDEWLENTWQAIMGEPVAADFVSALKRIKVFEDQGMRISREGKKLIAMITALSVAGEMLDEYGAIQDAGLEEKIKFGKIEFEWISENGDAPKQLTILREGLAQYAAGR